MVYCRSVISKVGIWYHAIRVALIPPGFIVCLALVHVKPIIIQCFGRIKMPFLKRMAHWQCKLGGDAEVSALINQEITGYDTFTSCTTIDVCSQWLDCVNVQSSHTYTSLAE